MPDDIATALVPAASSRMKRAAAFAFTASLGLAGCSSTTTASDANVADTQSPTDNGAPADQQTPTDTRPPTDTPTVTDTGQDVPEDFGNVAPPYGIPATDAGPPDDSGGAMADYGAPPPPLDGGR